MHPSGDFSKGQGPEDFEHNYRFIDDIFTLSGCIPTESDYVMRSKNTGSKEGQLVYLGMELKWLSPRRE